MNELTTVSQPDLRRLLSLIDLTSLTGSETTESTRELCSFALHPLPDAGIPPVAAICTFPAFVREAKIHLAETPVRVASVTESFPEAPDTIEILTSEVNAALQQGADEIDLVLNHSVLKQPERSHAAEHIAMAKKLCGDRVLKVILETSVLGSDVEVYSTAMLAMQSGADFVKTSTGKKGTATLQQIRVMSEAIKKYFSESGKRVGIKPAGGIATAAHAMECLQMVESVLGEEWINPSLFRFGASSLARGIVQEISGGANSLRQVDRY